MSRLRDAWSARQPATMTAGVRLKAVKRTRMVLAAVAVASACGCATVGREDVRMISGYAKWYYPATQEDVRALFAPCDTMLFNGFEKPLYLIDLPFSLVFDTILWPVDFVDGNYGRPHVRPKNRHQSSADVRAGI